MQAHVQYISFTSVKGKSNQFSHDCIFLRPSVAYRLLGTLNIIYFANSASVLGCFSLIQFCDGP
jgi:hypothetical protein